LAKSILQVILAMSITLLLRAERSRSVDTSNAQEK